MMAGCLKKLRMVTLGNFHSNNGVVPFTSYRCMKMPFLGSHLSLEIFVPLEVKCILNSAIQCYCDLSFRIITISVTVDIELFWQHQTKGTL